MPKRLPLTPHLRDLLQSATDGGVDPEKVAIFEAVSINTLPVRKRNIFDGAVHAENTLREMAAVVSERPLKKHVPIHTSHDQSYGSLPIGKVFHGEFRRNEMGVGEVRSLFYIGEDEEALPKIENSSVEEVSVGLAYKHINCSQCGWDYMSDEADFENFYDRKCKNDHYIGKDGVHVVLNGLDQWLEQSIVSLGAAQGAKIVAHTKALLGQERYTQLAANGIDPSATILFASATPTENNDMDLQPLIKELTDAKALILTKDAEIVTLKTESAKVAELQAQVATLNTQIAELQKADATKLQQKLTEAEDQSKAALSLVRQESDRLAVASGNAKLPETATMAELAASLTTFRTKLAETFGMEVRGGVELTAVEATAKPSIYKIGRK